MLAKENRLTKERDFNKIRKIGKTIRTKSLTIKFLKTSDGLSRFTVVVGKKSEPKATKRNYIKRRLRYLIKKHQNQIDSSVNMMIIANNLVASSKFIDLENEFISTLSKSQLIK